MLKQIKTDFYTLIKELGYNITDNGDYVDNFPWLMLRTNGYQTNQSVNALTATAILVLDIFSTYAGEKEIIEIAEDINTNLCELYQKNYDLLFCRQKDLKILDDNTTGPVRKHGVAIYEFLLGGGIASVKEVPDVESEI